MTLTFIVIVALLADLTFGEPRKFHPLVGFGKIAHFLEKHLNQTPQTSQYWIVVRGGLALCILIVPFAITLTILTQITSPIVSILINILVLYWAIGHQSLREHTYRVLEKCLENNVNASREQLSMIVSRNTEELNQTQVIQATTETVLENGSDAIFAPLFWFCLMEAILGVGATAVLVYRLSNTLDAMWGYRNVRFNYFGRIAARMDDVLNYIPARLVAVSYAILGNTRLALKCWRQQSPRLNSPNAGPVMTAGAGSLNIRLGGPTYYDKIYTEKPYFGSLKIVEINDIERSLLLIRNTIILWCLVIVTISIITLLI